MRDLPWFRAGLRLCAVVVAGCGDRAPDSAATAERPPRPEVPEAERRGGTLVVAGDNDLTSMNPLVSSDTESLQHQIHVLLMTLVRNDPDFQPLPYLAKSWEPSRDGRAVTIVLREDVKWHDGEPVTARDVVFTWETARNPAIGYANADYFDAWEGVEMIDEYTLRFTVRPTAYLMYGWSQVAILPEHILGDVPPAEFATHPFGTNAPVGNGPFRFVERVPGDRWVFEANPDFPEELGGRPYVDRYVYRAIPDDVAMVAALRSGEVDLAIDPPPADMARLSADPAFRVLTYAAPRYDFIAWNSRRPMFSDRGVRRALTMAIDRQGLVDAILAGYGEVATGPVGAWHWAYDAVPSLPFAPDSARAALEAAGWVDSDGDGVREKDGKRFAFTMFATPGGSWRDIAEVIKANLAAVGVDMSIEIREARAIMPLVTRADRSFDAFLVGWSRDVPLDERQLWACNQIEQPFQFTSYCNPAVDAVLDSLTTVSDRDVLDRLVDRYGELIRADQPYTFLYVPQEVAVARVELRDVTVDARGDWNSIADWWIEPAARHSSPTGS
jgi:peptide/nickel transport system substrate-binding protein